MLARISFSSFSRLKLTMKKIINNNLFLIQNKRLLRNRKWKMKKLVHFHYKWLILVILLPVVKKSFLTVLCPYNNNCIVPFGTKSCSSWQGPYKNYCVLLYQLVQSPLVPDRVLLYCTKLHIVLYQLVQSPLVLDRVPIKTCVLYCTSWYKVFYSTWQGPHQSEQHQHRRWRCRQNAPDLLGRHSH